MKVEVVYPVAIPVGHRIRVRWYRRMVTSFGLFGSTEEVETLQGEPVIEDLDTGVVHTSISLYERPSVRTSGEYVPIGDRFEKSVALEREVVGRVTACRVISLRSSDYDAQSELTIEPETEGYRQG